MLGHGLKVEQLPQITKDQFLRGLRRKLFASLCHKKAVISNFVFFLRSQAFKGIEAPDCHWEAETGNPKVSP